ncbi:MAG: sugar-binding domain-containing protein, partial [Paludibacter sp.]
MHFRINKVVLLFLLVSVNLLSAKKETALRERISLNEGWKFFKYSSPALADRLIYDVRPEVDNKGEYLVADAKPTEAVEFKSSKEVLKEWILPTANSFIADKTKRYIRPAGNPGADFPFVQKSFDDSSWENVDLPHDWAIKGPFFTGWDAEVGGGMGRLPVNGVGWYRRKITVSDSDLSKNIFLDIDGAMSYAMVWLNGNLVGGWPYGYNSWRVDLTPYLKPGADNQLA